MPNKTERAEASRDGPAACAEREAYAEQERRRQDARDGAKSNARREAIKFFKPELEAGSLDGLPGWFERLLQSCEKDADEIAREAAEEGSARASRTELAVAAYEVAYIEAYADVLPALLATALAKGDVLDPAA
jgi:hypothetical protein